MAKITHKIPKGWTKVTLENLINSGFCTIKNSLRQPLSSSQRAKMKGPYPYYGAAGQIDSINDYRLEGFHLLIAEDGTITKNGKNPMLQLVNGKFWVSNHAHVLQGKTKQETLLLYYMLSNVDINPYITGAVQPKLSKQNLFRIELLLPPLPEQKAIAEILSSLDDKIDLLHRQNQTLESLAQALFRKWFVDNPERDRWEKVKLIDIYEFEKGFEPGSSNYLDRTDIGRIRFIRVGDMLDDKGNVYISEDLVLNKCSTKDLLVSFDGTVGRVNYGISGGFSSGIRKIYSKVKTYDNLGFKYLLFTSPIIQSQIKKHASGTVILHASSSMKILSIRLPKPNYIESFNQIVTPIFQKTLNNKYQIRTLENLRDTLLPKLMSGEVRVQF